MFQMHSQPQLLYFDHAPVPMLLLNASGDVVHTNTYFESQFPYLKRHSHIDDCLSVAVWYEYRQYAVCASQESNSLSPYTRLVRLAGANNLHILKLSLLSRTPSPTYIGVLTPYQGDMDFNEVLLDRLPIGMARVDAEGQFIQVNQFFADLLGYPRETLFEKREAEISFEADARREMPLRLSLVNGSLDQYHVDKRYIHQDGRQLWVRVFVSTVTCQVTQQSQVLIAVLDIHEEKQLHEVIATSERRFRAIADNVSSVVWISGADPHRLYFVNTCYENVWEENVETLYSNAHAFLKHVHPADRDLAASTRFSSSTESWNINYRLLFADGRIKHIRDSGKCVFDGKGDLIYRVGTQTDITLEIDQRDTVVVMAKKLQELVEFDSLTGIKSRHAIMNDIQDTYREHTVTDEPSVLIYIDADGFKTINDNYGHDVGDNVLKAIAEHLSKNIRESDVAGRIGGDEFVVLLRHTAQAEIPHIIERLGRDIESDDFPAGVTVGLSLGAKELTEDVVSAEQWLNEADKKMYQNKKTRKMTRVARLALP